MGFFDFLKRKKLIKEEKAEKQSPMLPTVKPPPDLFSAFDRVFFATMKDIDGLSKAEKKKMHKIISGSEGGHLNQAGYYDLVYEQFFKNRPWTWSEFEKWQHRFDEFGQYPARWPKKIPDRDIDDIEILRLLRVSDLKSALSSIGVEPPMVKKDGLIRFIMEDPKLKDTVLNNEKAVQIREKFKFRWDRNREIYAFLIRTISFRAKSLCDEEHRIKLGMNRELLLVSEEERKFVDMALAENPDAYPPFFPGDLSCYVSRLPS